MRMLVISLAITTLIIFEWELIKTALAPLITVVVCALFILMLIALIAIEVALMVIAPIALFLGIESRNWHIRIARKVMFAEKK